ncbi:hypothetical protein N6L26_03945 [Qipengyuania sp. SS22]|uniref:hypothetical protein n=1 Tax=Qipengyuania sp. SS22 TaxID=2979461 RepID=UPI0021E5D349|nr:hypothetical protein [Qipengyuania sp. SS22]UYH55719.1 hypothetical protein N6L26_03945 [Qipengyuania sp. SS22]
MNTKYLTIAAGAAALFLLPASAVANGEKGVTADEDSAAAKDAATIVCKRQPPPVGSRLGGKRVCKTNAAWKIERDAATAAARENQDRSGTGNTRTSG